MDKLGQLTNFAAMKEAAVQAASKAADQMAGQLAQERLGALLDRLAGHLNSAIGAAGLDPFQAPGEEGGRTVAFSAPLLPCCGLPGRATLSECVAKGMASVSRREEPQVTMSGNSFAATLLVQFGPLTASAGADATIAGCVHLAPVSVALECDRLVLRLRVEGDFAQKRLALLTAESGLAEQPVVRPELRDPSGGGGGGGGSSARSRRLLRQLAERLAEAERQRLAELASGRLLEAAKEFLENPQSMVSL